MGFFQFCLAGFGIITLRLLLFPVCLILLILLGPLSLIFQKKDGERIDKFLDFYDNLFLWVFGPPFGFFSASLVFYILLVYNLIFIL